MAISYGYDRERPRTQVFLDSTALGSANVASEKPLVILGSAIDGEPHVPHMVTNFTQARNLFRGGDLLDAIEMAWSPSPNEPGAGRIYAVRTDEATQAKHEVEGLTVVSNVYGNDANGIQIEYGDSPLTGSKRFSVYFTRERYERIYDNIGNIFNVRYTGEEAQATVEVIVDDTTKLATRLVLSVGDTVEDMQPVRTYELGQGVYQDVNVLVNDIHNLPDFEARMNSMGGNKNIQTQFLDALAPQNIKNQDVTVTAIAGDLLNQTRNDRYVSLSVDFTKGLPESIELTNLSGGETKPAPASWAHMFAQIADLGAYYVVPLTAHEAIHGELSQFLREQSQAGNHLRGIVGGGHSESENELRSRQMNIRNSRVSLVGDSVTRRMADGRVLNMPGYLYASLIAGIASGLPVGEPVTYKQVNIESVDRKFTGDQLDQLNASGVIMTEFIRQRTSSYYRIVSDPTTYNVVTEPVQNRMSLGEVADYLTTELRIELDQFIGSRIQQMSASIIKNAVESFLDQQKNVGGLIVDYSPDDVQVLITGNTATINITVQPAQGLDYINVFLSFVDNELEA
ncbi:tail sheath [Bacillus phage Shbh1]|uniref:Tail sheath-like protein n=1 Tax=Bacillus phage Shbh1 TaxID=1796992 RepID=A0A142F1E2_9CAUD|nr:tail sheath [Bacillus phage Shbh1]AMQ66599.1 tail sheath-like protein [Bacillus phage Shbh1]